MQSEEHMATATIDKCANPACYCRRARESDFCGSPCELKETSGAGGCACGHAVCDQVYAEAAVGLEAV